MAEEEIGVVSDYFAHVGVAGVELKGHLRVGDTVHLRGHTTDFELVVRSMQIDRLEVEEAGPGASVGIKVPERCRGGDHVYKISA